MKVFDGAMHIPLTQGYVAVIDAKDYEIVAPYKWSVLISGRSCYAQTNVVRNGKKRTLSMHRLLMGEPPNMQVDHIDHDGLNNRRVNLRIATLTENRRNSRKRIHNTSGFKGVTSRNGQWVAQIASGGKTNYIGSYPTRELAAAAYDQAAKELQGNFAHTNEAAVL